MTGGLRRRVAIVAMIACASVIVGASCGGSSSRSPCGDRGAEHVVSGATYCVYTDDDVAASGGTISCPEAAPIRIPVGGAVVCTSDTRVQRPEEVPAIVCVGLDDTCGTTPATDAGDEDDTAVVPPPDAGDVEDDAGPTDAGEPIDAGPGGCPAIEARSEVEVSADVTADQTWSCDRTYRLTREVLVTGGATLTIQPGTVVLANSGGGLTALADGRLDAVGTASAPIVMTTSAPEGDRRAGLWLGVTMLGQAPLGAMGGVLHHTDNPARPYGGTIVRHDCGRLRYVRIEFAGNSSGRPGLALLACGRDTVVDHVQVHLSAEDAINIRGGGTDLHHIVATLSRDGGLDWDRGWTGRAQFMAIQSLAGPNERSLLRGSSREPPRTNARIFNATLVSVGPGRHRVGIYLDNGADATIRNALVWGPFDAAFDVVDGDEVGRALLVPPGIDVSHCMFFGMGDEPAAYITRELGPPDRDGDGTFDDAAWISDPSRMNRFGVDPLVPAADRVLAPDWVPPLGSPAMSGAATPPDDGFFDASATYVGAFEPGGSDWTAGWTAYPGS